MNELYLNDYISVSDPGKGPGRPRPPYLRVWMTRPSPPPYVKVWIRHSALEGGKAGKMTRELLDDTIARRKGQD